MMTSSIINVNLDIDINAELSCSICLEIIQTADQHRQCAECNVPICIECIRRFTGDKALECPVCRRSKTFSKNRFIMNRVYPKITVPCTYAKCDKHVIPNSGHVAVCKFRPITCPICEHTTIPEEIHEHIQGCTLQWVTSSYSAFDVVVKRMTTDRTPMGRIISMNNDEEKKLHDNDRRILYVWRTENDTTCIKLMCIQLSCTAIESKIVCQMSSSKDPDNMRRVSVPIINSENISNIAVKSIFDEDMKEFDNFAIAPGAHSFIVNDEYMVDVEDGDWTRSRLLETIQNPTRAVFVTCDPRRKLVVINLDGTEAFKKIRPVDSQSSSALSESDTFREVMSFIIGSIPEGPSSGPGNLHMVRGMPRRFHRHH